MNGDLSFYISEAIAGLAFILWAACVIVFFGAVL
jgi:hypothetical protein